MTILEICVDDAAGLSAAIAGGADRIELCAALETGGLTPSPGLIALAAQAPIEVRAMVRPRPGDFIFGPDDIATMIADIAAIRAAGLAGVVLGASLADGRLDLDTLAILKNAAAGLGATLHRAIDLVPDMNEAIEAAAQLGFDTILTSGRAETALSGLEEIAKAHAAAAGRLVVMAGAGVDAGAAVTLLGRVPLGALHGSCASAQTGHNAAAARLGFISPKRKTTIIDKVAALKAAIAACSA